MHFVLSRHNIDIEDEQSRNVCADDYKFVIGELNKICHLNKCNRNIRYIQDRFRDGLINITD